MLSTHNPIADTTIALEPVFATFDGILAAEQAGMLPQTVALPGWGNVQLKALKEADILEIERLATRDGERDSQRVKILSIEASLLQPKLTFAQIQKLLLDGRAAMIARLWTEINRINGMGEIAVDEADKVFDQNPRLEITYRLAELLGKTHAELLAGHGVPLGGGEVAFWVAYLQRKYAREALAYERARKET